MRLDELLSVSGAGSPGCPPVRIRGIAEHSGLIKKDFLFVAVGGDSGHGLDYLDQALARGASAVLSDRHVSDEIPVPVITMPGLRDQILGLCLKFYGNPENELSITGVTGTNGKTTTSSLIRHLVGDACSFLGTTHYETGTEFRPASFTTPTASVLAELLHQVRNGGKTHVVMEISSHALHQGRVKGLGLNSAVFTNLQREHLDYHTTMDRYFKDKKKIFSLLKPGAIAVINLDCPYGRTLSETLSVPRITFSMDHDGDIHPVQIKYRKESTFLELQTPVGALAFTLPLSGSFNVENTMAALGALIAVGINPVGPVKRLKRFPGVPGRLEKVTHRGITAYIDYAHTPDGMEKVLRAVREFSKKHIITVFGAGGDRDRGKRHDMGRIVGSLSDIVIITTDNPRHESPRAIAEELLQGVLTAGQEKVLTILDRAEAIRSAVQLANDQFILMLLGKGHEQYQQIGDRKIEFCERSILLKAMEDVRHAIHA